MWLKICKRLQIEFVSRGGDSLPVEEIPRENSAPSPDGMIPRLSFNLTVSPETARHDKISLKMEIGTIRGTTAQIDSLRHDLGNPSHDPNLTRDYLFCAPQQRGMMRPPVELRKRPFPRQGISFPPPLFAGELAFGGYVGADERVSVLTLYLDANPTRLARFQPVPRDREQEEMILSGDAAPSSPQGEFSLDGKDNWLLAGEQDAWHTPARWTEHIQDCFPAIRGAVFDELLNARDATGGGIPHPDEGSVLESCETYWEFESDNPIAHVREMLPLLADFGSNQSATEYRPPRSVRASVDGNCPSLSIEVRAGVFLRIYAKTNRRVRFEVCYDLTKNAAPLKRALPDGSGTTQARTAGNDAQLVALLLMLRPNAARIVNRALAHMSAKNSLAPSHVNETMLLLKIGRIVKNDAVAVPIAELLRTRGAIAPDGLPREMQNAIRKLKEGGVLRFNADTGVNEPTTDYAHAVRILRDRRDSLLTARQRVLSSPAPITPPAALSATATATAAHIRPARVRTLPPDPPAARVRTLPPETTTDGIPFARRRTP